MGRLPIPVIPWTLMKRVVSRLATFPVFKRPVIVKGTYLTAITAEFILFCFCFQTIMLQQDLFYIFDAYFLFLVTSVLARRAQTAFCGSPGRRFGGFCAGKTRLAVSYAQRAVL